MHNRLHNPRQSILLVQNIVMNVNQLRRVPLIAKWPVTPRRSASSKAPRPKPRHVTRTIQSQPQTDTLQSPKIQTSGDKTASTNPASPTSPRAPILTARNPRCRNSKTKPWHPTQSPNLPGHLRTHHQHILRLPVRVVHA